MARITGKVAPKDQDGKSVDITARNEGHSRAYEIITPDFYDAVVNNLKFATMQMAFKDVPNPATADGKWTYWKLTPNITILNENHTQINTQDVIMGILVDGTPYHPKGKDEMPIWKEGQHLLSALGLFTTDGDGVFSLDFDPDLIKNRVIRVATNVGGYIKSGTERGNFPPKRLEEMLKSVNNNLPYEGWQIPALVNLWNLEHGLTNEQDEEVEEGVSLRLKNYITYWGGISQSKANENNWFFDPATKAVYLDEASHWAYVEAMNSGDVPASKEETW